MKRDADAIKQFLDQLRNQPWLKGSARHWWPRFVFHYSDIQNALKILQGGLLLSRGSLEQQGEFVNSASPDIIARTLTHAKQYVRLYFRPRTPTQYANEGIRPIGQRKYGGAHCGVPVFLLFDSYSILTQANCSFSNGNLACHHHEVGNDAGFLCGLPFQKIYHVGSFVESERDEIIFRRNAEVLVPHTLNLSALRYIICRSPAERDSLVHLLSARTLKRWQNQILCKMDLFWRRWTFVERADLSATSVILHFSPETLTPGPFQAEIELVHPVDQRIHKKRRLSEFDASTRLDVLVPPEFSSYEVTLQLDGALAYCCSYQGEDIPF